MSAVGPGRRQYDLMVVMALAERYGPSALRTQDGSEISLYGLVPSVELTESDAEKLRALTSQFLTELP